VKPVFVFPGAGIETCGHEAAFWVRHRSVMQPFLNEASETAGTDLAHIVTTDTVASLEGVALEILTHAFNCGVGQVFKQAGIVPYAVAGHSLGVYSAVFAADAASFADTVRMVTQARKLVEHVCQNGPFGMAAIVGLTENEVAAIMERTPTPTVSIANRNNATSVVISGRRHDLERVLEQATIDGAFKAMLLKIALPYHCPHILASASQDLRTFLDELTWRKPTCPVLDSSDGTFLTSAAQVTDFTARNLASPVMWQRVIEVFGEHGVSVAIECGPGIALTQNARFVPGSPTHVNIKTSKRRLGI